MSQAVERTRRVVLEERIWEASGWVVSSGGEEGKREGEAERVEKWWVFRSMQIAKVVV